MQAGMRARIWIALLAGCLLVFAPRAGAAVSLQPVGSFDEPMFVTAPPGDPRLFVVERDGRIQVLHDGARTEFLDITTRVRNTGEQGLLSMAFDPNFASNRLFYVFYNGSTADPTVGDIHIDEFRVTANANVVDPGTRRQVLTIVRGNSGTTNHNGGQLQFGKDGLLYISVGDNANSANSQTTANLHGKILRVDPRGSAGPQIWSLGLRNPWRFSFDRLTGDMVIGDVGAGSREEIDFAPVSSGLGGGANYGWPNCEGFVGYPGSCPGSVAPVLDYAHSDPCNAVIAGYVYRGTQVPELAGRFVYSDLCHPAIRSAVLGLPLATGDRSEGIGSTLDSPTSFGEDSSCELYVAAAGSVLKIVSTAPPAVAPACAPAPVSQPIAKKKRKCKKRHKKKQRAAEAKKKNKKKCKKRKKKRGER
jgi:glucose/arabinose dehydrogenase